MTQLSLQYVLSNDPSLITAWNDVIRENSLSPQAFYQWKDVLEKVYRVKNFSFVVLDENKAIRGFALLYYASKNATLYSCRHGLYAEDENGADIINGEITKIAKKLGAKNSLLTSGTRPIDNYRETHTKESLYIPLETEDEESLWLTLPKKTKNMVRKAEKSGIKMTHDWKYLESFYAIYRDRFTHKSLAIKPYEHFKIMYESFPQDAKFIGALQDGKLIAGMIFISAGDVVSYAYNASSLDASNNGANNFLMWEAMKYFFHRGSKYIDLSESSPDSPVYKFKSRLSKNILSRTIFYYDMLSEKMPRKHHNDLRRFISNKIYGILQRAEPFMPFSVKVKYLTHLSKCNRVL